MVGYYSSILSLKVGQSILLFVTVITQDIICLQQACKHFCRTNIEMFDHRGRSFERRGICKYFTVLSSQLPLHECRDVCAATRTRGRYRLPVL